MDNISLLREARSVFAQGGNLSHHFRNRHLSEADQLKVIEYAYDLQSGSYTHAVTSDAHVRANKQQWGARLAGLLTDYGIQSAIEAGVGEASTLRYIVSASPPSIRSVSYTHLTLPTTPYV